MDIHELTQYFLQYGAFFIYLIVLLEYMNLPGFPAGVIMPLSGIWAAQGEISFPVVMILTVAAGLTGSWLLYLLGRFGGNKLLGFYFRKFPKHRPVIEEKMDYLREKGYGEDGFCAVYRQFRVRDIPLESGFCRGRVFLRGRGDPVFYITRRDRT